MRRGLGKEGTLCSARSAVKAAPRIWRVRGLATQTTLFPIGMAPAQSTEIATTRPVSLSPHSSCGEGGCVDAFPYRIVLANCRKRREISPTRPSGLDIKKLETRDFRSTTLVSTDLILTRSSAREDIHKPPVPSRWRKNNMTWS